MQLGLLPIAPILLLPFIAVFFVVVFPLWLVGLGVTGLAYVTARGAELLFRRPRGSVSADVYRIFRWVLTWGGFVRLGEQKERKEQKVQ